MGRKAQNSEIGLQSGLLDFVLCCLAAAVLISVCIFRSSSRLMWTDELLGYGVLTASSTERMLAGWYQGADGGGVFYYMIGRVWMWLFHPSALSLRLFSTCAFIVSMGVMCKTARRFYALAPVAIAIFVVYLTPQVMIWQEVNGRFYGFFVLAASLAISSFLRSAQKEKLTRLDFLLTGSAHALLIGSHILGLVYSASLIFSAIMLDIIRHRFRWKLYLSALGGWVMVPISWHAIVSSTSIAVKVFWTDKPGYSDLVRGAMLFDRWIYVLLFAAISLNAFTFFYRGRAAPLARDSYRLAIYAVIAAMLLAEVILFTKSQFGISIYADRYLQPLSAALVLLIADVLDPLFTPPLLIRTSSPRRAQAVLIVALTLCAFRIVKLAPREVIYPNPGYPERLISQFLRTRLLL